MNLLADKIVEYSHRQVDIFVLTKKYANGSECTYGYSTQVGPLIEHIRKSGESHEMSFQMTFWCKVVSPKKPQMKICEWEEKEKDKIPLPDLNQYLTQIYNAFEDKSGYCLVRIYPNWECNTWSHYIIRKLDRIEVVANF